MSYAKKIKFPELTGVQTCILLILIYVCLIFLLPTNRETLHVYHINNLEYRFILVALALPSILVWFVAFTGYSKLRQYAEALRSTPEGQHFERLASGTAWLAWSLPAAAITTLVLSGIANKWPSFHASSIIISNYINLLYSLIAFTIIGSGSRGLLNAARLKFSLASLRTMVLLFLTAGVLYCYLTFRRFDLTSLSSTHNPYFLPIWLTVLTVIIPYLYVWFMGLLASYEISLLSKQVSGVLYRQALQFLFGGLIAVIIGSSALQYLNSVQPQVGHLIIDYRLMLNLIFRLIGGIGFIAITAGAIRLKRIEEV